MIKNEDMPACNVMTTLNLVNSKWKVLIIRDLATGAKRNSFLKKSLSGISQKVLTAALKSLVKDGIVKRVDFGENPPHVEYSLTALGVKFLPVVEELRRWGKLYKQINNE